MLTKTENKLEIGNSFRRTFMFLLVCILFVIMSMILLFAERMEAIIPIGCIIFFGAGIFIFIRRLRDKSSKLTIDENGVHYYKWKSGPLAWDKINDITLFEMRNNRFISLHTDEDEAWLQSNGRFAGELVSSWGVRKYVIPVGTLKIRSGRLYELLFSMKHCPAGSRAEILRKAILTYR